MITCRASGRSDSRRTAWGASALLLLLPLCLLAPARAAVAASDGDEAALSLPGADTAPGDGHAAASDWKVYAEGALRRSGQTGGRHVDGLRLSLDARYDAVLAPGWRAVAADRLDLVRADGATSAVSGNQTVNTLKEAYVSWQAADNRIADVGRINVRNGVASGYNPTDYFREGAQRSGAAQSSLDPASVRENRMGSVMLRGQTLWRDGSLTAIFSPRLAAAAASGPFNPDLGATNRRERWQLALSHKWSDNFNPQWLLSGGAGQTPQLGVNLNALANNATVVYAEWSGGRSPSLARQAATASPLAAAVPTLQATADDTAFRSRLATGLTYTTSNKITLALEYNYNGAGLSRAAWDALSRNPAAVAAYTAYRLFAADVQDLPTREQGFFYATWQDALLHLDLTALSRYDLEDDSRLQWIEARYHWPRIDVAAQAQFNSGRAGSSFGVLPDKRLWLLLVRYYF